MLDDRLTEQRNPRSEGIDGRSLPEIVRIVNDEDATVAEAVGREREAIARAADLALAAFRAGGRLIYVGAGTSGRLGVLDAAEMPPTYGTDPAMVQGVIAGGHAALVRAQEGAEDHPGDGAAAMDEREVGADDFVIGIAASGTTPFVHGALERARERGARTGFLLCTHPPPELAETHDVVIAPLTGPEVVTGSTRMKAGTATKMVLNAITTSAMVRFGKVDGNLMVDLQVTCDKLQDRGERILMASCGIDREAARDLLARADGHVKTALAMERLGLDADEARAALDEADGVIGALEPASGAVGPREPGPLRWNRPAVLVGLALAVHLGAALSSARPDMHTGGDNAAYLALANSLARDGTYLEAWHPGSPPHTKYPPLYPGALALLILLGAQTWGAFKAASVVFTGLATAFCFLWVNRTRPPPVAGAVALLFGIAPGVVYSSQWVLSDPLFLACTFAALWLMQPKPGPNAALGARELAAGLALAIAAYFSRSAGLPLVVAAAAWLALGRRWAWLGAFGAAFAALALPWHLRSGGQYLSEFWLINPYAHDLGTAGPADLLRRVAENLSEYVLVHVPVGLNGVGGDLAAMIGPVLAVAVLAGWLLRVRRGPGVAEIFFVLYAGLILLWPQAWSGDRFALPLLPLVLLYAGEATALAARAFVRRPAWAVAGLAALLFALPAGQAWSESVATAKGCRARVAALGPLGCHPSGIREFHAMALWARDGLPRGSLVYSRKPRIFHAFSGHPSIVFPFTDDGSSLLTQADSLGVDHLVVDNWDATSPAYVDPVLFAHPERFCVVAQLGLTRGAAPISLLAILPPPPEDANADAERTGSAAGLTTCRGDAPVPPASALASMRVPILDRP